MIHQMALHETYFESIKKGRKKVEVRLNDEKRRKVKVGDLIEFISVPNQDESLTVRVSELRTYNTFEEMYQDIPFKDFDCDDWTMDEMIKGTYDIYTPEQEKEWGTLAITIEIK